MFKAKYGVVGLVLVMLCAVVFYLRGGFFASSQIISIPIQSLDGHTESGLATIREISNETVVLLNFKGDTQEEQEELPNTASIIEGSCESPGVTKYELTSIDAGQSETDLNLHLKDFIEMRPLAIIVYKSVNEKTVLTCGNI
jgi:hypothetical protein